GAGRKRTKSPAAAPRSVETLFFVVTRFWSNQRTTQHATKPALIVILHGVVQSTPVIPHEEVAVAPNVPIDEFVARRVTAEISQQWSALRFGHSDETVDAADVERLPPGLRMDAHEWMHDRRGQTPAFCLYCGRLLAESESETHVVNGFQRIDDF